MKLRKLARLCEHDEIKAHRVKLNGFYDIGDCPGGVFLPDDTLVIEKDADGGWPDWAINRVYFEANDLAGFELRVLDALALGPEYPELDPNQAEIPFTNSSGLW